MYLGETMYAYTFIHTYTSNKIFIEVEELDKVYMEE